MFKWLLIFMESIQFCRASELIVWNVGQGQWVSQVEKDACFHFDMGGEKSPIPQVLEKCGQKMNFIHLSHWDWDHISFVNSYSSQTRGACLLPPATTPPSASKMKITRAIPICTTVQLGNVSSKVQIVFHPMRSSNSNEASEVVYSQNFATLVPGDSPKKQEKIWASEAPARTRGLILGHHGSRTSTSRELLEHLPDLKWAVSTARKKRYGHPHREVVERLQKEKVPLLKTEDWGHLHFLKNEFRTD